MLHWSKCYKKPNSVLSLVKKQNLGENERYCIEDIFICVPYTFFGHFPIVQPWVEPCERRSSVIIYYQGGLGPSLPGTVLVYACCPSIIINSTSFLKTSCVWRVSQMVTLNSSNWPVKLTPDDCAILAIWHDQGHSVLDK